MKKIISVAKKLNLTEDDIEFYGKYMAKIEGINSDKKGKLILVSAMTPTTSGEGKTTVSIGLCDGLNLLGKKAVLSLREPSLGPVFGMKGGATGGGEAEICPSNEINLHFTGDMHAITSANNLICACIDNSVFQGNPLNIDTSHIFFNRCIDMNDRALREVEISLEKLNNQSPRKEKFVITAASEIMALLCLSKDFKDLKVRLGNIIIALNKDGNPIYAKELGIIDSMASLLVNAIKPNLVQTKEGNPCIVHGGPFANIAHGCSSVIATQTALSLGDYCITECGFGGDLGGEKFMDIVCRQNGLYPSVVILVATIKALKLHSPISDITEGFENLKKQIENFKNVYNQRVIVALNIFEGDSNEEINLVAKLCEEINVKCCPCRQFAEGGKGTISLAEIVLEECEKDCPTPTYPYENEDSLEDKIYKLASKVYGACSIEYSDKAKEDIKNLGSLASGKPIVVAKTQYSLSDNPKLIGRPSNFTFHISGVEIKNGSGFIIVKTGKINLMPGLSKEPNALKIKVDDNMQIHNLK